MPSFAYYDQLEQKINLLLSDKKFKEAFSLCKDCLLKYPNESRFAKLKSKIEEAVEEENEKIIKDKIESIKPLWKEEKYLEIIKILKNLLQASPNNSKLQSLYHDAEKSYKEQFEKLSEKFNREQHERLSGILRDSPNQLMEELYILEKENVGNQSVKKLVLEFEDKLIERKIKEKKELIDSNKYDVIANFLDELKKIDKENKRIKDIENDIKRRQMEGAALQTKEFVYGGEKHLDTLIKLKKFDKAVKVAEEILKVDPNNGTVKNILSKATEGYKEEIKDLTTNSIEKNFPLLKTEYAQDKTKFIKL